MYPKNSLCTPAHHTKAQAAGTRRANGTARSNHSVRKQVRFRLPELLEANDEVEADAKLQLVQTDGAQMRRSQLVLLQAGRAVHEALEEDAMPEPEHVADFMQRHSTQPPENQRLVPVQTIACTISGGANRCFESSQQRGRAAEKARNCPLRRLGCW